MSKEKIPQVNILLVENGAEIVTGLNILKAISVNPKCYPAFMDVTVQITKEGKSSPEYIAICLHAAARWIEEINRQVEEQTK